MKPFTLLRSVLLLAGFALCAVSCTKDDMEEAINQMLLPETYTSNQGVDVPSEATLFLNGEKVPLSLFNAIPPEAIESVTVIRSSEEFPSGEVRVQLKGGVRSIKARQTYIKTEDGGRIEANNIGEMIVALATRDANIMDYDYYIDGKKASLADTKKYSINMISSFKMNPKEKRVDIKLNKDEEEIPASPSSIREMLETHISKEAMAGYDIYKDGEKITLEELYNMPLSELGSFRNYPIERRIEIKSR